MTVTINKTRQGRAQKRENLVLFIRSSEKFWA